MSGEALFDAAEVGEVKPLVELKEPVALIGASQAQIEFGELERKRLWPGLVKAVEDRYVLLQNREKAGWEKLAEEARRDFEWARARVNMMAEVRRADWWLDRRRNTVAELLTGANPKPGPQMIRRGGPGQ